MILSPTPLLLLLPQTPPSPLPLNPTTKTLNPLHLSFRCLCRPEWGSNAEESVRRGRFNRSSSNPNQEEKRKWWDDNDGDYEDEEEEEFDEDEDEDESIWDKIWVFKVLKSYGYVLPVIIMSTLLTTGPKAFLMALAIPFGQTAVSFAIDSIWGKKSRNSYRTRRRPFSRYNKGRNDNKSNSYRRKASYQSWVSMDQGGINDESRKSGLGGWDELDQERENVVNGSGNGGTVTKLSKKGRRYNEVPLFMRLMVAVFPFLGSWFRIL